MHEPAGPRHWLRQCSAGGKRKRAGERGGGKDLAHLIPPSGRNNRLGVFPSVRHDLDQSLIDG
jgi:hypothetical protein